MYSYKTANRLAFIICTTMCEPPALTCYRGNSRLVGLKKKRKENPNHISNPRLKPDMALLHNLFCGNGGTHVLFQWRLFKVVLKAPQQHSWRMLGWVWSSVHHHHHHLRMLSTVTQVHTSLFEMLFHLPHEVEYSLSTGYVRIYCVLCIDWSERICIVVVHESIMIAVVFLFYKLRQNCGRPNL